MEDLIVKKEASRIKLIRSSTNETFWLEKAEVFGLILELSEATNHDRVILNAHSLCLEAARKQNS